METSSEHRRLLLIGWDAADWDIITPLMEAGRMPHLARLVREGVSGNLASLRPCLTPMLWTTIATGMPADRHGILGFVEPLPDHSGIVSSRSTTRKVPALWNMLGARGRRSCVVTWPVSDPPEEIPGTYVSAGLLDTLAGNPDGIGDVPAGYLHPAEAAEIVGDWRFHPCELAPADLASFIPGMARIDVGKDRRPETLARHFARAVTTHAIATGLLEREPWDLFAVYYETIDRTSHDFMSYRPPLMPGVPQEDRDTYGGVVDAMYEFHDAMLGRLLELAGPDTCVGILSDHGFLSGSGRPPYQPRHQHGVAEDGADWHRMMGMVVLHGPGLRRGETIHGATLYDVLPTLLAWLGLPVGEDMPGNVMQRAFETSPPVRRIRSWEDECPALPIPPAQGLENARRHFETTRQFVALGYLPQDALLPEKSVMTALREAKFNLAMVHLHHSRPLEALRLLEDLCAHPPLQPRYEIARLEALRAAGRHHDALEHLSRLEESGHRGLALDLACAASLYATGDRESAALRIRRALQEKPGDPDLLVSAAQMALPCGSSDQAEEWLRLALELDPSHAAAHGSMASLALEKGLPETALEHSVIGLRRYFFNPGLHWVMARALHRLGETERALTACGQVLLQVPSHPEARRAWVTWGGEKRGS